MSKSSKVSAQDALRVEAAARMAGGVVLGRAPAMPSPAESTPEGKDLLLEMAATKIKEQQGIIEYAQGLLRSMALSLATLAVLVAESSPDFEREPDGSFELTLTTEALERAAGIRIQQSEAEGGGALLQFMPDPTAPAAKEGES